MDSPERALVIQEQVDQFRWFHSIDLGNGVVSKGMKTLDMLQAEFDLVFRHGVKAKSVLDIGAWDGAFSFEADRRGAKAVVATDGLIWANKAPFVSTRAPFDYANRALGSRVHGLTLDVYNMSSEIPGRFDVVLFLGVLYHLKHPILALQKVAEMTRDYAIIDTETTLDTMEEPVVRFLPGHELNGDNSNWFVPNVSCMLAWLNDVGFRGAECVPAPSHDGSVNGRRGRYIFSAWK